MKQCSICGRKLPLSDFAYGNRENRSYCRICNQEEKAAYNRGKREAGGLASGGREAAREYRESKRAMWR